MAAALAAITAVATNVLIGIPVLGVLLIAAYSFGTTWRSRFMLTWAAVALVWDNFVTKPPLMDEDRKFGYLDLGATFVLTGAVRGMM